MIKVLIAPDKFKGSLTAQQVCDAVADGITSKHPLWMIEKSPLADGGEGTCEILTAISGGKTVTCKARDPLFREMQCEYGLSADGTTAFIEMASASGLQLLKEHEQNPMSTSSAGTGDLIVDALSRGVKIIILGCGGSATNDGGIGMASALGISFRDEQKNELKPIGESLKRIYSIQADSLNPGIQDCNFVLLSDVDNPLTGSKGAAYTYARQKGASDDDIALLDEGLKNFAGVLERTDPGITNFKGAGAAGGFPVSAKVFLNAEIQSGIKFIIEFAGIEEKIKAADLVITGEGKFDNQSLRGKVVSGIASISRNHKKKLWVICGISEVSKNEWVQLGIEKVIALSDHESAREHAIRNAFALIREKLSDEVQTLLSTPESPGP